MHNQKKMAFIEKKYIFKRDNKYFSHLLEFLYEVGGDGLEYFAFNKNLGGELFIEPDKVKEIHIITDSYIVDELEISDLGIDKVCMKTEDDKIECIEMFQNEFSYWFKDDEYTYIEKDDSIYINLEEVFSNRIGEIEKYPNPGCCLKFILEKGADEIEVEKYELEDDDDNDEENYYE